MTRNQWLGAAALAFVPALTPTTVPPPITGAGDSTNNPPYPIEFSKFNPGGYDRVPLTPRTATFSTYFEPGPGVAQLAFLSNDLSCDMGGCGAGGTVSYAASDVTLTADQIATWSTSSAGQSAAGNLIQLPSMGVGVAIPVVNAAIKKNGALTLSDGDLCGVFSGSISDFGQIKDSKTKPAPGAILVVYAKDSAGSTFWLTDHLAAVCKAGSYPVTFTPTTDFKTLFPSGVPRNFFGAADGEGVAAALACGGTSSALGYVEPAYTRVDPKSKALLTECRSIPSPLVAASLFYAGQKPILPTYAAIAAGLTHPDPATGQHLSPPMNAGQGADPTAWVPIVPTVLSGYPLVGYTTWDYAQCYANTGGAPNPPVGFAIEAFLPLHYGIGTEPKSKFYPTTEHANGNATLLDTTSTGFLAAISANILANDNGWDTDIDDATACDGLAGR